MYMRAPYGSRKYSRNSGRRTPYTKRSVGKKRVKTPVKRAVAGAKRKASSLARAPAKKAVKRAVTANTRAITKIAKQVSKNSRRLDGEYQTKTGTSQVMQLNYKTPLALHLNNLNVGSQNTNPGSLNAEGPQWIRAQFNNGDKLSTSFDTLGHEDVTTAHMAPLDHANPMCNGGKCKWLGTELQFEIKGYTNDTRVEIYVVQEKKGHKLDPWGAVQGTNSPPPYMPNTLNQWKHLVGFNANRINYQQYRVLAKKKVYLNSRIFQQDEALQDTIEAAAGDTLDPVDDEARVDATTSPVKRCKIVLRPNKMLYQIKSSETELGVEKMNTDGNPRESHTQGPWSYDNQRPMANTWLIICTDNQEDLPTGPHAPLHPTGSYSALSYNALTVQVIRRNWWQDSHAPTLAHNQSNLV